MRLLCKMYHAVGNGRLEGILIESGRLVELGNSRCGLLVSLDQFLWVSFGFILSLVYTLFCSQVACDKLLLISKV
jgi:hypothetical protein